DGQGLIPAKCAPCRSVLSLFQERHPGGANRQPSMASGTGWIRLDARMSRDTKGSRATRPSPSWLRWWTRSQPIRTLASVPLTIPLINVRQPFTYQQVAEKSARLRSLGMSLSAIARVLGTSDKTIAKALRTVPQTPSG